MTHQEAVDECARLAREHPARDLATWLPRRNATGEWTIVKVARPGPAANRGDLRTGLGQDVRPDPSQDVPQEPRPYWAGG